MSQRDAAGARGAARTSFLGVKKGRHAERARLQHALEPLALHARAREDAREREVGRDLVLVRRQVHAVRRRPRRDVAELPAQVGDEDDALHILKGRAEAHDDGHLEREGRERLERRDDARRRVLAAREQHARAAADVELERLLARDGEVVRRAAVVLDLERARRLGARRAVVVRHRARRRVAEAKERADLHNHSQTSKLDPRSIAVCLPLFLLFFIFPFLLPFFSFSP